MLECYFFFFFFLQHRSTSVVLNWWRHFFSLSWSHDFMYYLFHSTRSRDQIKTVGCGPPSWKTLIYVDIAFIVLFNSPMSWATLCRWLKWFSSSRGVTSSLWIPVLPHHRKWALTVRNVHSEVFSTVYLKLWMVCFATCRLYCVYRRLIGLLLAQVVFFTFLASRY